MIEILAPAGDEKSAYAAINSGADAIYLGLTSFSARSAASNFDFAALEKLIAYAHFFGVKIYVAMNTLVKDDEVPAFIQNAIRAHNVGADALIVQDLFLGKYMKQTYPQLHLHLSTQAGVNNVYGALLAKEYGFERVILARETSLADIKEISEVIQTEVFIQGALCTCFSGQCYLSSFAGGNSGNRGRCKQPCRKLYSIDRRGFEDKAYRLSLSDLSVGEDITKLIEAGVVSFKIEGRMRRPEYVAAAVRYYKDILSGRQGVISLLKRTYNRGNYTKGLAFGQDKTFISSAVQGHIGEFCGVVEVNNGKYLCRSAFRCMSGDGFKVLRGGKEICGASFSGEAKGGFYISTDCRLKNGDKVFITTDVRLNSRLLENKKSGRIMLNFRIACGEKMRVEINGETVESTFVVQTAENRPLTREDVVKCFDKVDTYPFTISYGEIQIIGSCFIPASQLNSFRREAYSLYFNKSARSGNEIIESYVELPAYEAWPNNARTAVISCNLSGISADVGILKPDRLDDDPNRLCKGFTGERYLYLPAFLSGEEISRIKPLLRRFDGIYCDGYYAVRLCKELGKELFAGTGFNIGNAISLGQLSAKYVAISKELTVKEAERLAANNTFYLSAGNIKVMDLIYCPFKKSCKDCDERKLYTLTDGDGRKFPLRRYKTAACRFELYNCANLVSINNFTGTLIDCTLGDTDFVLENIADNEKLKNRFKNFTKGHTETPVF